MANRIYKVDEFYFEIINSPEKAYILGFFYADGYNNESNGIVSSTQREDRIDILTSIKDRIHADQEIKIYPGQRAYSLTICSTKMSKDLANAGAMQCKSHILTFPDSTIVSDELIPHFIRGYFDGDGCI